MQAAIEAFDQGTDTPTTDPTQTPDSPDTPDTGDAFPWLAATLLGPGSGPLQRCAFAVFRSMPNTYNH